MRWTRSGVGIMRKKGELGAGADIRDCFGSFSTNGWFSFSTPDRGSTCPSLDQEVAEAGVLEEGEWSETEKGDSARAR